jgi:hypothetical protein
MPRRMLIPLAIVMLMLGSLAGTLPAGATYHGGHDHTNGEHDFADHTFERTWARTDHPVASGAISRTWMWGPEPLADGAWEEYAEAPGGMRKVQYFDKSRMEDNTWRTAAAPWDVTNGLLVIEMMTGRVQVGDHSFVDRLPADIHVVGDPGQARPITYALLNPLRAEPPFTVGDHIAIRAGVNEDGSLVRFLDHDRGSRGVTAAHHVAATNHTVASVFWEFMNSTGTVYENGQYVTAPLFQNPFYATGYPITEAFWTDAPVGGTVRDVLFQCFERRCLTWTPGNPAGWTVEAGNVGQHYRSWRHGDGMPGERLFVAHLSGDQEVPPVATAASGEAAFFLSDDGMTLHYHITLASLTGVTMAHIHTGGVGVNGPPLVWLFPADGPPASAPVDLQTIEGTLTAADVPDGTSLFDLIGRMASGQTYVNVHTSGFGAGEVRGQIMPAKQIDFGAVLDNEHEVVADPANQPATGASGVAWLRYSHADGSIVCEIGVSGIVNVTMAHIHLAPAGANGPPVTWLFPADGPPPSAPVTPGAALPCAKVTPVRLNIPAAMADAIDGISLEAFVYQMLIGNTYVNIHTSAFPAGEIRGQIYVE